MNIIAQKELNNAASSLISERADDLVSHVTLGEKISQITNERLQFSNWVSHFIIDGLKVYVKHLNSPALVAIYSIN